jgi:hypothetical protein
MSEHDSPVAGQEESSERSTAQPPEERATERDAEELIAEVELLKEENRRLRESYARAHQTKYRRTAIGLAGLGILATIGAAVFPMARTVLLALGATGAFGGLLTYYLTPERFVPESVGAEIYATLARTGEAISSELGLADERIYVPTGDTQATVKLFVPQHDHWEMPDDEALESVFVVSDRDEQRGVAFDPTGSALFEEFERALDGPLGDTVSELVPQLRDALVEQFEVVDGLDVDSDAASGRLSARIHSDVFGTPSRLDHPVTSFLAVGLARGLDEPIRLDVPESEDDTITFRWATETPPDDVDTESETDSEEDSDLATEGETDGDRDADTGAETARNAGDE